MALCFFVVQFESFVSTILVKSLCITSKAAGDLCRYLWSELQASNVVLVAMLILDECQGNAPPAESVTFFADKVGCRKEVH